MESKALTTTLKRFPMFNLYTEHLTAFQAWIAFYSLIAVNVVVYGSCLVLHCKEMKRLRNKLEK